MNSCNGFVAAFHLQGSSWDRGSRQFRMHARNPPPLETQASFPCSFALDLNQIICARPLRWSALAPSRKSTSAQMQIISFMLGSQNGA